MTLREEFVLRALEPGANVSALCREYEISRKTGYKWLQRFREAGRAGLEDMSRRPHHSPLRTSGEIVMRILELKADHPRWGPKKIHVLLVRSFGIDEVPSMRTVAHVLDRAGLVQRRRKRVPAHGVVKSRPETEVEEPNDLWTVDFKGWWRTVDGRKIEPLTVRDAYSRFVLAATALEGSRTEHVQPAFTELFERHGLPKAIQVDNGSLRALRRFDDAFSRHVSGGETRPPAAPLLRVQHRGVEAE